ncbi:hypothetical protein C4D60_Mb11t22130 [Musa balbisiana]|uniref:Protein gar2 n=1 Tax=Musa balbisiana TaxID=52838 RepID=A0A4S8J7K7_MUSBA|nr:hypothetical protein C4D60_Mb11t22130 [Musa balbisiana]
MVLANKKLKKKLRDLLAESQSSATESTAPVEDVSQELQTIKSVLSSKSKKRPKRRKKPSHRAEEGDENNDAGLPPGDSNEQQKSRKRKRDGGGGGVAEESVENGQEGSARKKRKERKKERRKKDQEHNKGHGEEHETADVDCGEKGTVEASNLEQSGHNAKKVYVGGIPYYSSEDDIRSFFEGCGTVTEMDCMTFPESGKFRGIAILTFKTEAAAKRALALDGADMGGFYLKIQPYKSNRVHKSEFAPEIVEGYNRIYIGNLAWDITEDDLRNLFSDCKVTSIRFGTDKATGDFKGYAHVDFADNVSLTVALKLDQKVVCGRPVRIRCAVPKKEVESKSSSKPFLKKDKDSKIAGSTKKKRQTCYVCGVPGHLSSSCPKKSASAGVEEQVMDK